MLYVVRHADAGDKHLWLGDDAARPLTRYGWLQSDALVGMLARYPVARVVSSPTVRCVQTVAPLARLRGVPLQTDPDLAVEATPEAVRALVGRLSGDAAVLCTHGEVIGRLLDGLFADGVARPPGRLRWQKGSVWVVDGLDRGNSSAWYLAPPLG